MQNNNNLHPRLNNSEVNNLNDNNLFPIGNSISCVNKKVESVTIPKNVTSISFMGFSDCENLTEIDIPDNIAAIGKSAFDNCKKLETINIPENVTNFNDKTFYNCTSLKNINLPGALISLGDYCFYNCQNIESLNLPQGIDNIGEYCFKRCENLTTIELPDKVSNLGEGAFFKCLNLKSIKIPSNIDTLHKNLFAYCSSLEEIDIPANINHIEEFAFFNCDSLESVFIHKNIKSISAFAFSKCSSLKQIELADSLDILSPSLFEECSSLETAILPSWIDTIPASIFKNCSSLTNIKIPQGVKAIKYNAFEGCESLDNINLPVGLRHIGASAFYKCKNLTNIELPEDLISLDASAFDSCISLEEVKIPKNIINLNKFTFFSCNTLKKVELPKQLYSIGYKCFANCTSLEKLNLNDQLYSIDNSAFENCTSLTSMRLPDSLRVISQYAFKGCTELNKLIIPENIQFISSSAFDDCPNLVICAPRGSYAHKYAVKNNIKFEEFNFLHLRRLHFADDSITLNKGDIKKLDLILTPPDTNDIFTVSWESSEPKLISVDNQGLITCKDIGSAVITAKTEKKSASCTILSNIKLEEIKLSNNKLELSKDQTIKLKMSYFPEEHILQSEPIWTSSDETVAVVDQSGNITSIAPGKCSITCTLEDKSASCDVNINIPVQEIKFDLPIINTKVGEIFRINPIIVPADTTDDVNLEWQSSNGSIIELQPDNSLKALAEGRCVLIASYKDKIATCIISIASNINSIHFKEDKISLSVNKSFTPQIVDNNGNEIPFNNVLLSIADPTIAKLDGQNVVALKNGITVLIAQMQGFIATCIMTVVPDKINLFTVNYIKESSQVISGKGLVGASVRAYNGTTPISDVAIVDENQKFVLPIDNSKLGSIVLVEISKEGYDTRTETIQVLKEFKEFTISSIDEIAEGKLEITGIGFPESHIRAYIKNMEIGKTALVNTDKTFTINIPKVKDNTTVTLKMRKSNYVTALRNITIKY